jgi:hypothetical protein
MVGTNPTRFPERRHSIANRCIAPGERTIFIAAEHAPKVPSPPLSSPCRTTPTGGARLEPLRAPAPSYSYSYSTPKPPRLPLPPNAGGVEADSTGLARRRLPGGTRVNDPAPRRRCEASTPLQPFQGCTPISPVTRGSCAPRATRFNASGVTGPSVQSCRKPSPSNVPSHLPFALPRLPPPIRHTTSTPAYSYSARRAVLVLDTKTSPRE